MSGAAPPLTRSACTPLAGPVVTGPCDSELRATASFTVSPQESVLPGHYPGFPIFPGVCLVECVHTAALGCAPASGLSLAEVVSTRFTGPAYPEDHLTVDLAWQQGDDGWLCRAVVRASRGDVAQVKLRYAVHGHKGEA